MADGGGRDQHRYDEEESFWLKNDDFSLEKDEFVCKTETRALVNQGQMSMLNPWYVPDKMMNLVFEMMKFALKMTM